VDSGLLCRPQGAVPGGEKNCAAFGIGLSMTQSPFCNPFRDYSRSHSFLRGETPPSGITLLTVSFSCLVNSAHCRNIDSHDWGMCGLSEERMEFSTAPNRSETSDYYHG
jgi:hypothetical protein